MDLSTNYSDVLVAPLKFLTSSVTYGSICRKKFFQTQIDQKYFAHFYKSRTSQWHFHTLNIEMRRISSEIDVEKVIDNFSRTRKRGKNDFARQFTNVLKLFYNTIFKTIIQLNIFVFCLDSLIQ